MFICHSSLIELQASYGATASLPQMQLPICFIVVRWVWVGEQVMDAYVVPNDSLNFPTCETGVGLFAQVCVWQNSRAQLLSHVANI